MNDPVMRAQRSSRLPRTIHEGSRVTPDVDARPLATHIRRLVRDSLHFHRTDLNLGATIRGALCLAITLSALGHLGRLDLAVFAVSGAVVSVYGNASGTARRWRTQFALSCLLTSAVLTGSLTSQLGGRGWFIIPVAAAWAALATWLSLRQHWVPPGALFLVFAATATAMVSLSRDDLVAGCLLTAATASLATLLGVLEVKLLNNDSDPAQPDVTDAVSPPGHSRGLHGRLAAACASSVILAGTLATGSPLLYPSWALVASVVPFATIEFHEQIVRSLHRVSGTAVGLLIVAGILLVVPMQPQLSLPWFIALVIGLQGGAQLLVAHNYGLALVLVTPLALLLTTPTTSASVEDLLISRILETVLGVTVGLLVAMLVRTTTLGDPNP